MPREVVATGGDGDVVHQRVHQVADVPGGTPVQVLKGGLEEGRVGGGQGLLLGLTGGTLVQWLVLKGTDESTE